MYKSQDIPVNHYRYTTYETVTPSKTPCSIDQAFTLSSTKEPDDHFIYLDIPKMDNQTIHISDELKTTITDLKSTQKSHENDDQSEDMIWSTVLECLSDEHIEESEQDIPTLERTAQFNLFDLNLLENNNHGFLAKGKIFILGKKNWYKLPSLAANEELVCYHSEQSTPLQFKYSKRDNFYYVKPTDLNTCLEIYVYVPYPLEIHPILQICPSSFSRFIIESYRYYRSFGKNKLDIDSSKEYTGQDYIDLLYKQKIGACRHRAALFQYKFSQKFPELLCRIVSNDVHAFIELNIGNHWYTLDLGGYPANIQYIKPIMLESYLSETERNNIKKNREEHHHSTDINAPTMQFKIKLSQMHQVEGKVDLENFVQQFLSTRSNKRLIECQSIEELECLQYGLQSAFQKHQYPFYYAHKPDDLHCKLKRFHLLDDGSVEIKSNHPLLNFLLNNQTGCLIINYDTFSSEEYVSYNEILDNKRLLHGIAIPHQIHIIGLRLQNHFVPENDFYSRFTIIQKYPLNHIEQIELPTHDAKHIMETSEDCPSLYSIQLYNSPDWESILIGKWHITTQGWSFEKGKLIEAIESGEKNILLLNGPWDNDDFRHFWKQMTIDSSISYAGRTLHIPSNTYFFSENGYDLETYYQFEQANESEQFHILNPYSYSYFFQNYSLEGNTLIKTNGYIQDATSQLSILISEPVSRDQWAKLVFDCKARKLALHVAIAPSINKNQLSFVTCDMPTKIIQVKHTTLIITNDIDGLLDEYGNDYIIDVSEFNDSELLSSIVVETNADGFSFSSRQGFLDSDLIEKRVVLKGIFSPKLINALTPLILKDSHLLHLVIITEDEHAFSFMELTRLNVDRHEYMKNKYGDGTWLEQCKPNESIAEMTTRYHYLRRHPNESSSNNAWQGMLSLEACHKKPSTFALNNEQLCLKRDALIRQVLENQPCVYIAGISGVGKSTFIKNQFIHEDEELFIDDSPENVHRWINSKANLSFLFIDEANLKPSHYSQFEGLFLPNPALFYNGHYHLLSKRHKVIFAGNPLNYGDERQFARFFQRHGNAIVFEPLPLSIIEADVIKPILKEDKPALNMAILKLYSQLCELSENELLISPRELQNLALWATQDNVDIETLNYYIYYMLKNMLDDVLFAKFCQKNEISSPPLIKRSLDNLNSEKHLILPSRAPTISLLLEQLKIHQLRSSRMLSGYLEYFGGLGGILIEGAVGLGKSELVKNLLDQLEIQAVYLSASMSITEKQEHLMDAFYNGKIAWMDELNTSPVLEELLNSLLMGKTPSGHLPKQPGFMLIVTQNPPNMLGRRQLSTALLRRCLILKVDEYSLDEMIILFQNKGLNKEDAMNLAHAYQGMKGQVSFRDALKLIPEKTKRAKRQRDEGFFDHSRGKEDHENQYERERGYSI